MLNTSRHCFFQKFSFSTAMPRMKFCNLLLLSFSCCSLVRFQAKSTHPRFCNLASDSITLFSCGISYNFVVYLSWCLNLTDLFLMSCPILMFLIAMFWCSLRVMSILTVQLGQNSSNFKRQDIFYHQHHLISYLHYLYCIFHRFVNFH